MSWNQRKENSKGRNGTVGTLHRGLEWVGLELGWVWNSKERGRASWWLSWWRIRLPMQETQETQVWSLGQEDPLKKEMATCPRILAWKIPWTEKPGGLQSMGLQRVGHDWACMHTNTDTDTHTDTHRHMIWNSGERGRRRGKSIYQSVGDGNEINFLESACQKVELMRGRQIMKSQKKPD